jgi:hypothetical protein
MVEVSRAGSIPGMWLRVTIGGGSVYSEKLGASLQ